jgi:hypothetical protein
MRAVNGQQAANKHTSAIHRRRSFAPCSCWKVKTAKLAILLRPSDGEHCVRLWHNIID